MQVSQLQVSHDSVQDRLLLRIGTQANEEIRVFLTRRFVRELWAPLTAMLTGHLGANRPLPAAPEEASASASFDEPFRDNNPTFPLGSTPLLVGEAALDPAGEGQCRLILREIRERAVTLNLNAELAQVLCSMLRAATAHANWNLDLDYIPVESPVSAAPVAGKALLH